MTLYYLFASADKTLVLPSTMLPEKINPYYIFSKYEPIGEMTINPFDFTMGKDTLKFRLRHSLTNIMEKRKKIIDEKIRALFSEIDFKLDQENTAENIYRQTRVKGDLHVFEYTLHDIVNIREISTKLLFLQSQFDSPLPEKREDLDIPLWLYSQALFGTNPGIQKWHIEKSPVGTLDFAIGKMPFTLELMAEDFVRDTINAKAFPF